MRKQFILIILAVLILPAGTCNFDSIVGPDGSTGVAQTLMVTNATEKGVVVDVLLNGEVLVKNLALGSTATIDLSSAGGSYYSSPLEFLARGYKSVAGGVDFLGCETRRVDLRSSIRPWGVSYLSKNACGT
jgi:hypothetical protein